MYAEGVFEPCEQQQGFDSSMYMSMNTAISEQQVQEEQQLQLRYMQYETSAYQQERELQGRNGPHHKLLFNDKKLGHICIFICLSSNVFTFMNKLKNATRSRVDTVLVTSIGAALILYLFIAIEGYRTYGSEVRGDIFVELSTDWIGDNGTFACSCLCINVCLLIEYCFIL